MTGFWLLVAAAAVFVGWRVSLRLKPWTLCRKCGGQPRDYGLIATRSFSKCSRCGGTGHYLRWGAKPPTT